MPITAQQRWPLLCWVVDWWAAACGCGGVGKGGRRQQRVRARQKSSVGARGLSLGCEDESRDQSDIRDAALHRA